MLSYNEGMAIEDHVSGILTQWAAERPDLAMMVTSGTMTNRIDRLAEKGLVRRVPDPEDRRGILVELTEQGRELIDSALISHVANEARLLQPLSREEQSTLAALLSKWLSSLENHS